MRAHDGRACSCACGGSDLGTGTCIATTTIILKYGTVQVMHITINYGDQSMRLQRIFSRDSLHSRGGGDGENLRKQDR